MAFEIINLLTYLLTNVLCTSLVKLHYTKIAIKAMTFKFSSAGTYSDGPSSVDQTVRTLEVAVRVKVTLVQIFHSFSDIGHQRQLKRVVQLDFVVHQYVLHQ